MAYLGVYTLIFLRVALYMTKMVMTEKIDQTDSIRQKPSLTLVQNGITHSPNRVTA